MNSVLYPACDVAAARIEAGGLQAAYPRMVLTTTILASSLAFVDGSVVNVGLPAIGRRLQGDGAADLQWVINAYLLPLSALLLFGGALGDRFGRRNALILGVALFTAASAGCALAPSLMWLLAGRSVQGIGAALLMPASLAGSFLLLAFLWIEHRKGDRAMMPLALFASRSFVGITLLTLLLYGALTGLLVLVPYVLIREAGYSGLAAGAALLPLPLVIATTSPMIGALSGHIGARIPLIAGPLVVAAGFLLATRIGSGSSYWTTFLPAILVIALGIAGAVAPLTTAVLTSVDAQHTGSASGFNSAVARTGGLVATALLGSVLAAAGPELIAEFHVAVAACSVASLAAAISAYALIAN